MSSQQRREIQKEKHSTHRKRGHARQVQNCLCFPMLSETPKVMILPSLNGSDSIHVWASPRRFCRRVPKASGQRRFPLGVFHMTGTVCKLHRERNQHIDLSSAPITRWVVATVYPIEQQGRRSTEVRGCPPTPLEVLWRLVPGQTQTVDFEGEGSSLLSRLTVPKAEGIEKKAGAETHMGIPSGHWGKRTFQVESPREQRGQ